MLSLGEVPHDPHGCYMHGEPHLGACGETPPPPCTPYFCPSTGHFECCGEHGGFDTCCARPELHLPLGTEDD